MDPNEENRLLRLAMARGLLHWEDLDAVADRLAAEPETGVATAAGGGSGEIRRPGWIEALVEAGRLDAGTVAGLAAELASDDDDRTPELGTPSGSGFLPTPGSGAGSGAASGSFGSPADWSRWAASLPAITSSPATPTTPPTGTVSVASPARARAANAALALGPEFQFLAGWQRYRIDRFLGAGGMGTVFKAWDPSLGRYVALKFLHRDDPAQTARFLREARAQARVGHPNICQVHEVGEVAGRPYIAMQYIAGRSLAEREVRDRLTPERKVRLVKDVALAIHAAHRTGLVHRDLKPGNVLVGTDESGDLQASVVDFGLAQSADEPGITRSGLISGTPAYVSPEQAEGKPLDRRSDVYSLGVVLYELLTGRPPFVGSNPTATLVRVIQEEPAPLRRHAPAVPADLETVVLKCLEKDPNRRYGSARELAEELARYLDGEPVLARPAGWAYRAAKRLRKNRALAAVAAAALIVITLLGGYTLRAQLVAGEKAELAQAFGQRVQRLESDLRSQAFQPRHDTTPSKASIRRELAAIQQEMASLGELAEGAGHYALGRGYLALHQDELAAEHLERAWRAGERGPEVAAALGRVVGILGEKALAGVRPEIWRAPAAGQAAREEVARTYSRPALLYLKEGLAGARQDPYLTALIARYERRFPAALALAREAQARDPRFYEAVQLEADILADQADAAAEAGRGAEALGLFDQAGAVYTGLLARVPSDAALYAADCRRRGQRIGLELRTGAATDVSFEAAFREAFAACDLALAVDRSLGEALALKADLHTQRADARRKHGDDPRGDLQAAIEVAGRAARFNPRDDLARTHLATALRLLGDWQLSHGLDPSKTLAEAVRVAQEAVNLRPNFAGNHTGLGTTHLFQARYLKERGLDARQAVERGAGSYEKALELNPGYLPALINLGAARHLQAEVDLAQGRNPSQAVQRAVTALERAATLDPQRAATYNNLGNAHLTLAEYLLARGADAEPALTKADASYRKALELHHPYGPYNLAWTQRSLALAHLQAGRDPGPALDMARRYLVQARDLNPNDADVFLEEGRVELLAGRWEARQNRSPANRLAAAQGALNQATALNPEGAEIVFTKALVELQRADWDLNRNPREAAAAIRRGLALTDKALALRPGEGTYLAAAGALHQRAARLATDATLRRQRAAQAVQSLEKALAANPLLAREFGPDLAEARRSSS
jgi:eukaryotic-like serine/threonine-protein kinase